MEGRRAVFAKAARRPRKDFAMRIFRILPALLTLWSLAAPLEAHDPGLSSATLWLQHEALKATLTFSQADIEALLPMDLDGDGRVSESEFEQTRPVIERFAREGVQVSLDDESVTPAELSAARTADQRGGNIEIQLRFPVKVGASRLSLRNVLLRDLPLGHRHYVQLFDDGANLAGEALLDRTNDTFEISLARGDSAASTRSFGDFFTLGMRHILTGYDHLLFLFGLLVVGMSLGSAARIITSFTVAHSITLALATFGLVRLSPAVVEPLIALSITYVGFENILRRNLDRRWLLTFAFGLIHGLGFASVLREMGVGATAAGALRPLLAFNLGVETGQIGIAGMALPLILYAGRRPGPALYLRPVASVGVIAMGTWWLFQRAAWL
jgi:hydrogenase/urease accessory protein HupE